MESCDQYHNLIQHPSTTSKIVDYYSVFPLGPKGIGLGLTPYRQVPGLDDILKLFKFSLIIDFMIFTTFLAAFGEGTQ